jgi:hypothetical protein
MSTEGHVWNALRHLESIYPGFPDWYWGKVIPGLEDGTRKIFASWYRGSLAGIVIAKSDNEKKICTVWVADSFRGMSMAGDLMSEAMLWLDTDRPVFTVSDLRILDFSSLIDRFGFEKTDQKRGLYAPESTEFIFNS